jgi:hypothetical protein
MHGELQSQKRVSKRNDVAWKKYNNVVYLVWFKGKWMNLVNDLTYNRK